MGTFANLGKPEDSNEAQARLDFLLVFFPLLKLSFPWGRDIAAPGPLSATQGGVHKKKN